MSCEYQIYPAMGLNPPEWCENDAVEDDVYCSEHAEEMDVSGYLERRWELCTGR